MSSVIKWLLVALGGIIVLYALLIFTGILTAPVYLRFGLYQVIMLFAGIGILFLSLGFFPAKKKE
jgi:hypothetical protein